MESQAYPMLFSPIKAGTQEAKNRVFMPPSPPALPTTAM